MAKQTYGAGDTWPASGQGEVILTPDSASILRATGPGGAVGTFVGDGATGAAGAISATLPAVAGKRNFLTGFQVTGAGATAASVITVTVVGLLGGTRSFKLAIPAGATAPLAPLQVTFPQGGYPASAVNIAIVVNVPSFGAGNTDAAVTAQGYVV